MNFERLDSLLKERGISRRKLALSVGILPGTMSTAFSRRRGLSADDLLKISRFLHVNPFYLEGIMDDPSVEAYEDMVRYAFENSDDVRVAQMLAAYKTLNTNGRIEAVKRVEELTEITRYTELDEQGEDNGQG